jgi:hypothetical protein
MWLSFSERQRSKLSRMKVKYAELTYKEDIDENSIKTFTKKKLN